MSCQRSPRASPPPHTAGEENEPQRIEPVFSLACEELLDIAVAPGVHHRPGASHRPGWVGGIGRIATDEIPADRIPKSLVQGGMYPTDGGWSEGLELLLLLPLLRERSTRPALREELGVVGVDVGG
jgi:hypothetical protein